MRIGFVGASYTAWSSALADEECINLFAETVESQGTVVASKAYGGSGAQSVRGYYGTPGLQLFSALDSPIRGQARVTLSGGDFYPPGTTYFVVAGSNLVQLDSTGAVLEGVSIGTNDGNAVSMCFSSIQLMVVSAGSAFCFNFSTGTISDVTSQLAGIPVKVEYSDGYFIVMFQNSNKFQISAPLDGTTWPGLQVNEVSVFPENLVSISVNHRELWVFGDMHAQPYQDTGSDEIFDVIPGTMLEKGCAALFSPALLDNSVFWIDEDTRGARSAWRSNGYTPVRISTHAVENDLTTYADISGLVSYSYADRGHIFWVLYIPGSQWSWVYDVTESLWHKRAAWRNGAYEAHHSWNHAYVFNKHLVGDWATGTLYEMNMDFYNDYWSATPDSPLPIRRLRRAPTVIDEMERVFWVSVTLDFEVGLGPQVPLTDGAGNPRDPQCMLRWSDDRGKTWGNEHLLNCGQSGQYRTRVIKRRMGQSRYRVLELSMTDPIKWALVDAYVKLT